MQTILINIIKNTPQMIKKLFCGIILIADSRPTLFEKFKYFINVVSSFSFVAWMIEGISGWYISNNQFANFVLIAIILNLCIGSWYHYKMGTFKFEQFIVRNSIMILVLLFGFIILEMLKITLGDNIVSDGFGTIIRVSTLLYPLSKCLKNLYILSNKQFPPSFIMERLYKFEKTGNINDLIDNEKEQNELN